MHLSGGHTQQQRKQPGHHQPLDVVGVAVFQGLGDGIAQAGHVGVASPVPAGQFLLGIECVALEVAGHLCPVDAPHEFAPAQDLADETLHAGQRCLALPVGGFCGLHHLAGMYQFQVECRGELGVVEPGFAGPQGVFVAPEQGQAMGDERPQGFEALCAGDRPGKAVQPTRVVGKALVDQVEDSLGGGVGFEAAARRQGTGPLRTEGFAVVGVEVPLTPFGLAIVGQQDAVALAQFPVEILQPQLFSPFGVGREVPHGGEEMPVVPHVQGQTGCGSHGLDRLPHPPIAGGGHHQLLGPQLRHCAGKFVREAAAVVGIVQPAVVQGIAFVAQCLGEMPHGGQKQRRALFAGRDVGRLLRHLGHPHGILLWVESVECGGLDVELVAQHDHQMPQRGSRCVSHGGLSAGGRRWSSISPHPRCGPSVCARSWDARMRRKACWARRICCL